MAINKPETSNILSKLYGFIDVLLIAFLVYDFGFLTDSGLKFYKALVLVVVTVLLLVFNIIRIYFEKKVVERKMFRANIAVLALVLCWVIVQFFRFNFNLTESFVASKYAIEVMLLAYFALRLTKLIRRLYNYHYNPAILFVGSFVIIALIGALMLMLPAATTKPLPFVDALFTSTSAVCVTGLIVVDTSTHFTVFGQTVILVLIQLGGIGMLTFTSFFAYFFKGGSSYKEGIYVKDFVGTDNIADVLKTAMRIVLFTFALELIGALLIYFSIADIAELKNKVFVSIFHSISAFCNAGFSTLSDGLYDVRLRNAYQFQWVIMGLIVFGGLGYNIVYNLYAYFKQSIINFRSKQKWVQPVRVVTLNSKIVLVTTLILLVTGTVFIGFFESGNILQAHQSFWGKFSTAAFTSVTSRTAGFNTFNFAELQTPVILFVILLMWIGASPASTGGGIKTSTFALATLNIIALARGRNHIEIGTRRIADASVKRAFAIISISLIVIGIAILMLLFFENKFSLLEVAFEVFSAYSTVGLSLGITFQLSDASKLVLTIVMFFGRIGLLNLMIGMLRSLQNPFYEYPEENILIN